MATINYPSNPVDGQRVTFGAKTWQWSVVDNAWNLVSNADVYAANAKASELAAAQSAAAAALLAPFNFDGGSPSAIFGSLPAFDGGTP
jgi:hypothetical protein